MPQGEREMASASKLLRRFDLSDIPAAPRGMPQIEVTFDIDANGILHVSAKDKATNKEQSIVIKSAGGLSDEEIDKMVKDAEEHAESDKAFQALATAKNQADNLIYTTEKTLKDLKDDQVSDDERSAIENAISELKEAVKGDDLTAINDKTEQLSNASSGLAEKLWLLPNRIASTRQWLPQVLSSSHSLSVQLVRPTLE